MLLYDAKFIILRRVDDHTYRSHLYSFFVTVATNQYQEVSNRTKPPSLSSQAVRMEDKNEVKQVETRVLTITLDKIIRPEGCYVSIMGTAPGHILAIEMFVLVGVRSLETEYLSIPFSELDEVNFFFVPEETDMDPEDIIAFMSIKAKPYRSIVMEFIDNGSLSTLIDMFVNIRDAYSFVNRELDVTNYKQYADVLLQHNAMHKLSREQRLNRLRTNSPVLFVFPFKCDSEPFQVLTEQFFPLDSDIASLDVEDVFYTRNFITIRDVDRQRLLCRGYDGYLNDTLIDFFFQW